MDHDHDEWPGEAESLFVDDQGRVDYHHNEDPHEPGDRTERPQEAFGNRLNADEYIFLREMLRAALRGAALDQSPEFPAGFHQNDIIYALMNIDSCWPYIITSWPIPSALPSDRVPRFCITIYYDAFIRGRWCMKAVDVSVREDTMVWMITQALAKRGIWGRMFDKSTRIVWGMERRVVEGQLWLFRPLNNSYGVELDKDRTLGEQQINEDSYITLRDRLGITAWCR